MYIANANIGLYEINELDDIDKKINITASAFSSSAVKKIEKAGGTVTKQ